MNLLLNIEYDFAYPPKDTFSGIRFAIPLQNNQIVYMYEDFDSTDLNGFIILLDTQLFIKVWQNLPDTFQTKDFQHSNKSEWLSINKIKFERIIKDYREFMNKNAKLIALISYSQTLSSKLKKMVSDCS